MDWLRTWKYITPIAPTTLARGVIVMSVYLVGMDIGTPFGLDPVAFALALSIAISLGIVLPYVQNQPDARDSGTSPRTRARIIACLCMAGAIWISQLSAYEAMTQLVLVYLILMLALFIGWHIMTPDRVTPKKPGLTPAMQLTHHRLKSYTNVGAGLIAAMLVKYSSPLVFMLFLCFLAPVWHFFGNWVIYLILRAQSRQ